jgi:hypothetical protein
MDLFPSLCWLSASILLQTLMIVLHQAASARPRPTTKPRPAFWFISFREAEDVLELVNIFGLALLRLLVIVRDAIEAHINSYEAVDDCRVTWLCLLCWI